MLIDIRKHGLEISGVIHVGAHYGQEHDIYKTYGCKEFYYIEPNPDAFKQLIKRVGSESTCFNVACGAAEGSGLMYSSPQNQGQSNSLLEPKKHLKQHPDIKFTGEPIEVPIRRLDSLGIPMLFINTLVIDVQGFEAEVLKGATGIMNAIEYVYCEVNRDETYVGCAKVEEVDALLSDFKRIDTVWVGTWGDALYVRKSLLHVFFVPAEFKPHQIKNYPADNNLPFEEWISNRGLGKTSRIFLDIHWTAYYVNNQYGQNKNAIERLQYYLDSLDKTKKYYTVIQYDDGILNDVSGLDLKVFSMSGKPIHHTLPLLSTDRRTSYRPMRYMLANFVGQNTHPIRTEVLKLKQRNMFISSKPMSPRMYTEKLLQSVWTLAPRGYGPTSFRISEAVRAGSIPVYISDEFLLPYDMPFDYGLLLYPDQVEKIPSILAATDPKPYQHRINEVKEMFTYQYAAEWIIKTLSNETPISSNSSI